jgi:hypothetical protein
VDENLFIVLEDIVIDKFLFVQFNAGFEGSIDDEPDEGSVADKHLVVEADMIEEVGGSYSSLEVGEDIGNIFHELLLAFQVVEAE